MLTPLKEAVPSLKLLLRTLAPFFWKEQGVLKYRLFLGIGLILVSMLISVYIPLLLRDIIESLTNVGQNKDDSLIKIILLAYGLLWTTGQVIGPLKEMVVFKSIQRSLRLFCRQLLERLHDLPFSYHTQRPLGELTNSLERAQRALPVFIWGLLFLIIPTLIEMLWVSWLICYLYNALYALILGGIVGSFLLFSLHSMKGSLKAEKQSHQKELAASAKLVDSLLNYSVVKYFNAQAYELAQCDEALKRREVATTRTLFILERVKFIQGLILGTGLILLLILAELDVQAQHLKVSDFILLQGYILQFSGPLTFIGFVLKDAQQSYVDLITIATLLKEPSASPPKSLLLHPPLKSIVFDKVTFGHDPAHPILKDVSFSLPMGKTTAFVGASGAGKSTLFHLLLGFYKPQQGRVLLNDIDVHAIDPSSLFALLGLVPQEITFFHTTLEENLLYARRDASPNEVAHALNLSCFDIKTLPQGLHTYVGERGACLSQGEKQRLALARLFLKNPTLCLLDEPTSSLDTVTEKKVHHHLNSFFKEKTVLMIAHRLQTVVHAHHIIVLEQGKIIEQGTHNALLRKGKRYASLWQEQKLAPLS